jgi:ATP-dependent DNA helicase RecG
MDRAALDTLLAELRSFGTDHQTVEAKRASSRLPDTAQETLIAFANADGGTLLLGVDEQDGQFEVVGVENPALVTSALQAASAELEPPLRPRISMVDYADDRKVIVAEVAPLPRTARPCHRRADGPHNGSFIRVGDADQRLSSIEVGEMLANRAGNDLSRRPAPPGAGLDTAEAEVFAARIRAGNEREADQDTAGLLRRWGALLDEGVSIAGVLALGEDPAALSPAARIAYRVLPVDREASDERFKSRHLEGRIGTLLDDTMQLLERDLETRQVTRRGRVYDDLDVPRVALREVVANALLHRSLSPEMETASVAIEISTEAIVVTSPGGLHVTADPSELGLAPISGVRNLTLVRLCERLTSPAGDRIIENQASGIAAADAASHDLGVMPPLFVDLPASFQVVMLREQLDIAAALGTLRGTPLAGDASAYRLLAGARRLDHARQHVVASPLARVDLDARLAARILAPAAPEDAAALLRDLERIGALARRHSRQRTTWVARSAITGEQPSTTRRERRERIDDLVLAIARSQSGELRSSDIMRALGFRSTRSANTWINRAVDKGLIEPNTDNPFAPSRAYRLTPTGRALGRRLQEH